MADFVQHVHCSPLYPSHPRTPACSHGEEGSARMGRGQRGGRSSWSERRHCLSSQGTRNQCCYCWQMRRRVTRWLAITPPLVSFVISVPGLWSFVKRSVKSKIVQRTFVGEGVEKGTTSRVTGEILSFFIRNYFVISDRGETITFKGTMVLSRGQASLLTFCTCISLANVALVLTITFPDLAYNWFWITILSPFAGAYYWKRASRKERVKVKMMVGDDGTLTEIIVQGDDQQVDQLRKDLQLCEKGMVYVKGIFER